MKTIMSSITAKSFFNGCQSETDAEGTVINVRLEVYNLSTDETIFSTTKVLRLSALKH